GTTGASAAFSTGTLAGTRGLSCLITGVGSLETPTFLNATEAGGGATRATGLREALRCGLAIRPSRRRTPTTTPTIVPAVARRPRRHRERGRGDFADGASGAPPARSARYALTFSSGSIPRCLA